VASTQDTAEPPEAGGVVEPPGADVVAGGEDVPGADVVAGADVAGADVAGADVAGAVDPCRSHRDWNAHAVVQLLPAASVAY
jgi:hypothetical protein